jgi:hypothetical protein
MDAFLRREGRASGGSGQRGVGRALVTEIAILLQRLIDDPFQFAGKIRIQPHRSYGSAFQNDGSEKKRSSMQRTTASL